ncbi:RNA polymerase sigma factor [Nocardioides lijunqiniae]|uniref:RNA polymerase sigma factor n=1 Tax=Nocardioides lijunqiniae TaxID=2760832 RepID=UPI001878E2C6|nr:sigma-70 family RNA polymerase sigma factor [Nocardioides lijunqiniae]
MTAGQSGRVPETSAAPGVWSVAADAFERWRDGDLDALDELVALMTPVLWHVVRAYRLSHEQAEDVVQSTWLALVRRRDAIDDPQAVGGWLTLTSRRAAWRVSARAGSHVTLEPDVLERHVPSEPSAESTVVAHDERDLLWRAVAELDERCQRLLRVVAFEQRPDYAALSADLQMPVGSIGPTRGRCLAKLRTALTRPSGNDLGSPT